MKINTVVERGKNDHTAARPRRALSRHRHHRAVHRVHGRRHRERLAAEAGRAVEGAARRDCASAGRCRRSTATIAARSRNATRSTTAQGEIGFISSVSEPFCGDCHRARLSADGTVYTCLFASSGTELRTPLRAGASDADLVGLLQNVWRNRTDRYSEIRGRLLEHKPEGVEKPDRVEMYRMGG